MANIFSGLFSGGGGRSDGPNAIELADYKQRLKEFDEERIGYGQQQGRLANKTNLEDMISQMSPERQAIARYQQGLTKNNFTYDSGQQGLQRLIDQRGQSIGDQQRQALQFKYGGEDELRKTIESNARHQYKVDNPLATDGGKKLEYTKWYMGLDADQKVQADRANRARQLVDKGTYWEDLTTGETYDKNVGEAVTEKKNAEADSKRYAEFPKTQDAFNNGRIAVEDFVGKLEDLKDNTTAWTTGYGSMLRMFPNSDARKYVAQTETVNAKTVLEAMVRLKRESPTGSTGFGAVNERELSVMMDGWGKLDPLAGEDYNRGIIESRIKILQDFDRLAQESFEENKAWAEGYRSKLNPEDAPVTAPTQRFTFNPETGELE